jgi:hypothetical protein
VLNHNRRKIAQVLEHSKIAQVLERSRIALVRVRSSLVLERVHGKTELRHRTNHVSGTCQTSLLVRQQRMRPRSRIQQPKQLKRYAFGNLR